MIRPSKGAWGALAVCAGLALSAPAHAQSLDDRLRAQLRIVTGQLNDLQSSQASLQAQKAAAEQERDALKVKLAAAQRASRGVQRSPAADAQAAQLKDENAKLQQANQDANAELQKDRDALAKASADVQQLQAERDRVARQAAGVTQSLGVCTTRNRRLVQLGREMARAYSKLTVADALARGEPFFGLKRVEMEKTAQDFGDQVYDNGVDVRAPSTPGPAPKPAEPPK
jgi:chromosome segregation ATPase